MGKADRFELIIADECEVFYPLELVWRDHTDFLGIEDAKKLRGLLDKAINALEYGDNNKLFLEGKLSKRVCSWCEKEGANGFMGFIVGDGKISHVICECHLKQMRDVYELTKQDGTTKRFIENIGG